LKTLINYHTKKQLVEFSSAPLTLNVLVNLDEAIEQICDVLVPQEGEAINPFAEDCSPYFGVLWQSAVGLSMHVEKTFKNNPGETTLEIGCGLAVPSLLLAKLGGNVIATDYHPDVAYFLKLNTKENKISVPFLRAKYDDMGELKNKKFSRVMGSDILYEYKHIRDVGDALIRHMDAHGEILLADPGRSYLQEFSDYMKSQGLREEVFTYKIAPFFNDQEKHRDVFVFRFWRE